MELKVGRINLIIFCKSNSTNFAQIVSTIYWNIVLQDVIVFVVLQSFILLREAFRLTLNFGL